MKCTNTKERIEISQLEKLFRFGEKKKQDFKTGIEYERVPINIKNGHNSEYYDCDGILNLLNKIAHSENWQYITDATNGNVLGLRKNNDMITLEPGCQIELSIEPEKKISQLENKINALDTMLEKYMRENGITLLNCGITPLSTQNNIHLLPKSRYHLMARYMWGILSDVMMRETAGIQCCIDFESEEDMSEKFKTANKMMPFMTAMFANSPIRGGVETGYKSFRALSWLYTDNERCGFAYDFDRDFTYKKYIEKVLNVPMIFITRQNDNIKINGRINFKEFMQNGFSAFDATIEDFNLHSNLYFPEVRLREFIEIRNHDCVPKNLMFAIPSIYKAILYKKSTREDVNNLLKKITAEDFEDLRYNVPKLALEAAVGKYKVSDISKEIIKIAEKSLIENNEGEEKYLENLKELTFNNLCPADVVLKNFKGDVRKILFETRI